MKRAMLYLDDDGDDDDGDDEDDDDYHDDDDDDDDDDYNDALFTCSHILRCPGTHLAKP